MKGSHQFRFGGEYRRNLATDYFYNTVYPRTSIGANGTLNASNPNNLSTSTLPGISAAELTLAQAHLRKRYRSARLHQPGLQPHLADFRLPSERSGAIYWIQQNFAGYFQDSWKVRRNLTFQYGVRWEYQGPYDARNGLVLLPQNNLTGLFRPDAERRFIRRTNLFRPGRLEFCQTWIPFSPLQARHQWRKPVSKRDLNNFGPFVGPRLFAWQ